MLQWKLPTQDLERPVESVNRQNRVPIRLVAASVVAGVVADVDGPRKICVWATPLSHIADKFHAIEAGREIRWRFFDAFSQL